MCQECQISDSNPDYTVCSYRSAFFLALILDLITGRLRVTYILSMPLHYSVLMSHLSTGIFHHLA